MIAVSRCLRNESETIGSIEYEAIGCGDMKKRASKALLDRASVIAIEQECNRLDLIWRNLLEEDV